MLPVEPWVLVVAGLAVLVGAVVQGSIGFGLGVVAAPVLALVDPRLVPGTLLLVIVALPALTVAREARDVDWHGVRWALVGRVPGTAVGAYAVVVLSERALSLVVALVVLGAVALSLGGWRPGSPSGVGAPSEPGARAAPASPRPGAAAGPGPRSMLAGGLVSGVTGTATSVGGPPMAILYQHSSGARIRSTLAVFFLIGSLVSVAALVLVGEIGTPELLAAAVLLPFMAVGFLVSGPLRRPLDRGFTRPAVLALSAGAALVLGTRALLG